MLVEDDALLGMVLAELLSGLGHTVCAAVTTEATAVATALQLLPDLMLVDLGLASGDGVSAMRRILRTRAIPHVFMSGAPRREIPAGAAILRKPFGERELISAMDKATERARPTPG